MHVLIWKAKPYQVICEKYLFVYRMHDCSFWYGYWLYIQYILRIKQKFKSVDVSVCRRFGLSTFRLVDVLVCRRFGLSTFWFVDVSVCRRFGLSTLRLVDFLICRCLGLSTFWLWTFRFVDVLTCNHLFYSFITRNEQNKVSAFLRHIISITIYACSLQYHSAGSHLTMNQWMVSTTFAGKQLSYIIFISCYTCIHIYIIFHKVLLMQNPKL